MQGVPDHKEDHVRHKTTYPLANFGFHEPSVRPTTFTLCQSVCRTQLSPSRVALLVANLNFQMPRSDGDAADDVAGVDDGGSCSSMTLDGAPSGESASGADALFIPYLMNSGSVPIRPTSMTLFMSDAMLDAWND